MTTTLPATDALNVTLLVFSESSNKHLEPTCDDRDDILVWVYVSLPSFFTAVSHNLTGTLTNSVGSNLQVVLLVLVSFGAKRKRLWPGVCGGRPALLTPIDFVGSRSNRMVYLVTFGSATGDILNAFFSFLALSMGVWLKLLASFLVVALVAGIYAPILVCVKAPQQLIGYFIGFFYSSTLLAAKSAAYFVWVSRDFYGCLDTATIVLFSSPYWMLSVLVLWYGYRLVMICCRHYEKQFCTKRVVENQLPHYANYVKHLLKRQNTNCDDKGRLHQCVNRIYEWDPYFRYPTRLLATLLVSGLAILYIVVELADSHTLAGKLLKTKTLFHYDSSSSGIVTLLAKTAGQSIPTCAKLAVALSAVVVTGQIMFMMINYKSTLKRLCCGDKSMIPEGFPSPAVICRSSLKYSGYQIAFVIWGWFVNLVVVFVVLLVLAFFYWWIKLDTGEFLEVLGNWITPFIVAGVMWLMHFLLSTFVFLEDRGAHMSLTNRSFFMIFSYFFFFNGIVVGFFTCLKRVATGIVVGVLQLMRLDQCLLPRGWESWDTGYRSFVGTLLLDYYHSNPSMLTFVYLLSQPPRNRSSHGRQGELSNGTSSDENCEESERTCYSCLARNRWLVAYTLINNPSLIRMKSAAGVVEQIGFVRGLMASRERARSNCSLDSCGDDNALMEFSEIAIVNQQRTEGEVHGQRRETEV